MFTAALLLTVSLAAAPEPSGVTLSDTASSRKVSLTEGAVLESGYLPSLHSELRLTDDLRLLRGDSPAPLDQGGGVSSDVRQILSLVLGFFPGFGLGHLIAHDRNGFILFLIIDIVLLVVGATIGFIVFQGGFYWGIGGLLWLVVHIIQALDAYASAGGERFLMETREKAVRFANSDDEGRPNQPLITSRILRFDF
ncbi:MAG: hypothetical protein ACJ790_00055 [Myxococcaceae bacterium]